MAKFPELQKMIAATPFLECTRTRHIIADPQMHLHMARSQARA